MVDPQVGRHPLVARRLVRALPLDPQRHLAPQPVPGLEEGEPVRPGGVELLAVLPPVPGADHPGPRGVVDVQQLRRPVLQPEADLGHAAHGTAP